MMSFGPFETRVPGKWVLAGEHAVLRGAPAIAFPHPDFSLRLRFEPASSFEVIPTAARPVVEELLRQLASSESAASLEGKLPQGTLILESSIPTGAGLGSSAALCVAVTRWLAEPLRLPESRIAAIATELENHFHGKSSGMDVAACTAGSPIRFFRGGDCTALPLGRLPRFTFHDTGLRAATSQCIQGVEALWTRDRDSALRADEGMALAADWVCEGLRQFDQEGSGLGRVAEGMNLAHESFRTWSLVPELVERQIQGLRQDGALAAKLTGAGGGGFIVALWA